MAGNTIKGISVSIGGNTVDLKKSMAEVEKESKSLQSELTLINKQLKFDPKNSVLLAQKQEVLEERILNTHAALEQLESVQKQVEQQAKNGDLGADKYRAYQREVESTKGVLKNLEDQLDKVKSAQNDFESKINKMELNPAVQEIKDVKDEISELETKSKKADLSDLKKEVDDVKKSAKELKDALKETVSDVGKGVAGAAAGAGAAIMSFDSVESALNHIQVQTGKTDSEMNALRDSLNAVYEGNYGEDMNDIANVMSAVIQFTNESDPAKIQKMTESVFTLSDAYGYDYVESLRTVKMLMYQFGISSEEAFNLIVQGTQKGLNKNGDLLDTINEYSVHYKQLGYSAEEFFNSLDNGTAAGTFSVDKLGDAMKEFGIRTKDTASSTVEGFELLGYKATASSEEIEKTKDEIKKLEKSLSYAETARKNFNDSTSELTKQKNADDIADYTESLEAARKKLTELTSQSKDSEKSIDNLQARFAAGGDSAKEATQEILKKLFAVDDQVKQNQIGVDLFGTMWEDLGIDGVKALMDVSGTADKTADSMQKINETEYDDVSNNLEKLGRKVQTEIVNPLVEDIYPEIEDGIDWIADNLDGLISIIKGVATEVALVWGVKKTNEIVKGVINLITTYKNLAAATKTATNVQKGLNAAQKADVISAVATAVITLVTAIDTYNDTKWENSSINKELDEAQKLTDKWKSLADGMTSKIDEINDKEITLKADINSVNEMKDKLKEIIDDGTIDESEVGEYKTIVDLLSEKVDGFDTQWNSLKLKKIDGKIVIEDNIDDVNSKLDQLVTDWEIAQAKIMMSAVYNDLMSQKETKRIELDTSEKPNVDRLTSNLENYIYEKSNLSKKEAKYFTQKIIEADGDFYEAAKLVNKDFANKEIDVAEYRTLHNDVTYKALDPFYDIATNFFKFNNTMGQAYDEVTEQGKAIAEANSALNDAEGAYDAISNKLNDYQNGMEALNGGLVDYSYYIDLATEHGLSHEAVLSIIKDKSIKTWDDLVQAAEEQSKNTGSAYREGVNVELTSNETNESFKFDGQNMGCFVVAGAKSVDYKEVGTYAANQIAQGADLSKPDIENSGFVAANSLDNGTRKISLFSAGASLIGTFISGIFGRNQDSENAGETAASKSKKGAKSVSLFSTGNNLVSGFVNGILGGNAFSSIATAAASVAENAYTSIKKWLGIESPSKETKKLGRYFSEGFAIGISENSQKANAAAETLAKTAKKALNFSFGIDEEPASVSRVFPEIARKRISKINISDTLRDINNLRPGYISDINNSRTVNNTTTNSPVVNVNFSDVSVNSDNDIYSFADKVSVILGERIVNDGLKWG